MELNRIIFDVIVDQQSLAHQVTNQAEQWQEDESDKIQLGDGRNVYTNSLKVAHVQFYNVYTAFINGNCLPQCRVTLSSQEISHCLRCDDADFLQFPTQRCRPDCSQGDSGM